MQSKSTQEITLRYTKAIDEIPELQKWGAKKSFFEKYKISESQIYRVLRNHETQKLDPSWIAALVVEFNVSAIWILTGRGNMYANRSNN